jgi:hypothetical protein
MKAYMNRVKKTVKNLIKTFSKLTYWQWIIVVSVFAFAVFVRVFHLSGLGFYYDTIETQYKWAEYVYVNGYGEFWSSYSEFFDYLPGGLLYDYIAFSVSKLFGGIIPGSAENDFVFILKVFNGIFDFLIAFVITYTVGRIRKLTLFSKLLIFSCIFASPSLWFISGVWGQFDSLIVLLTLIAVILLYKGLSNDNIEPARSFIVWSGMIFGLAVWTKLQALIILPVILIMLLALENEKVIRSILIQSIIFLITIFGFSSLGYFLIQNADNYKPSLIFIILVALSYFTYYAYTGLKEKNTLAITKWVFGLLLSTWLMTIIPLFNNPLRLIDNFLVFFTRQNLASVDAFNFWYLLLGRSDTQYYAISIGNISLPVSFIGVLLYSIVMVMLYLSFVHLEIKSVKNSIFNVDLWLKKIFARRPDLTEMFIWLTISSSVFFLFMTKMHTRYLVFGIIFSILPVFLINNLKIRNMWILGTIIIHLSYVINQLSVYNKYSKYFSDISWVNTILSYMPNYYEQLFSILVIVGFIILLYTAELFFRFNRMRDNVESN